MAASVSNIKSSVTTDGRRAVQALVTPSASYASNASETISPAALGLSQVQAVYTPQVDILDRSVAIAAGQLKRGFSITLAGTAAAPILRFWETNNTEVADLTDKSASTFTLVFVGV